MTYTVSRSIFACIQSFAFAKITAAEQKTSLHTIMQRPFITQFKVVLLALAGMALTSCGGGGGGSDSSSSKNSIPAQELVPAGASSCTVEFSLSEGTETYTFKFVCEAPATTGSNQGSMTARVEKRTGSSVTINNMTGNWTSVPTNSATIVLSGDATGTTTPGELYITAPIRMQVQATTGGSVPTVRQGTILEGSLDVELNSAPAVSVTPTGCPFTMTLTKS